MTDQLKHKAYHSWVAIDIAKDCNVVIVVQCRKVTCLDHPEAVNQTFLVSDGEDLLIADLLKRMGAALGIPVRLFSVPTPILKWGGHVLGKAYLYHRLCESLQLDIRKTCETLN